MSSVAHSRHEIVASSLCMFDGNLTSFLNSHPATLKSPVTFRFIEYSQSGDVQIRCDISCNHFCSLFLTTQ